MGWIIFLAIIILILRKYKVHWHKYLFIYFILVWLMMSYITDNYFSKQTIDASGCVVGFETARGGTLIKIRTDTEITTYIFGLGKRPDLIGECIDFVYFQNFFIEKRIVSYIEKKPANN